jgi:hypothetical protein
MFKKRACSKANIAKAKAKKRKIEEVKSNANEITLTPTKKVCKVFSSLF